MAEEVHYWLGTRKTFLAVMNAAHAAGVTVAEWAGQAVLERLEQEAEKDPKR